MLGGRATTGSCDVDQGDARAEWAAGSTRKRWASSATCGETLADEAP
jgi:hypothetical protein